MSYFVSDKEAVSPDGDSTTAPPSQASEHSEAHSKTNSNNGRPHPIDTALMNSKMKFQASEKKLDQAEVNISNAGGNDDEDVTNNEIRDKLESPTGSYDSNNSNANNVPGQISSMDITRMKKVFIESIRFLLRIHFKRVRKLSSELLLQNNSNLLFRSSVSLLKRSEHMSTIYQT